MVLLIVLALLAPPLTAAVEFNRDIRSILSDRCFFCHGPDNNNRKANLRLDQEQAAKTAAIVPGDPAKSKLYQRIASDNKTLRMPPAYLGHDKLPQRDIDTIRKWIEEGAPWQNHWSFIPPTRPAVPKDVNAIDYFVRARLDREGWKPSPEASPETLIRRLSLDLTGLPPTPDEVDRFLKDGAYEKVVDRLLASPRYAERMAIRWLEAARYADTNGYQSDGIRSMWRWRDWVIDAFRKNMPFDQFTIEQIAGDLLPNPTLSQKIATAFQRNHRTTAEGGIIDEEFRVEYVADRTETTATVWLGLTMGCARCHDHKFDPMTQRDFYSLFAFYNNLPEKGFVYNFGNEEPYVKAPTPEQQTKLNEYDAKLDALRKSWDSLQTRLAGEQVKWERSLRKRPDIDWLPVEGLLVRHAEPYDGKQAINLGNDLAKYDHRDAYTISARFNAEAPKGCIVSRIEDYFEGTGWGIYLIDGKIRFHHIFRWTDLGMRIETKQPVPLHEWHTVTVTYDGSMHATNARIYLDGVEQELKILFDQPLWPINHKAPLRIGAGGGEEYNFKGKVEDLRAYNVALTPGQIAAATIPGSLSKIAAIPARMRSAAQADKLHFAFVEQFMPQDLKQARKALLAAQADRDKYYGTIQTVMVMQEGPAPRDAFILKRGAYDAHGEKVTAAVPAFLPPLKPDWPSNRLGLARWLVSRDNPLTARVAVNRFWQLLFGVGHVKTVEDFGSQGEWPIHPELLDWLAVEFMDSGWDVKHILKTIVMSAAYRQSSNVTPELLQRDPENRLLARGSRSRLSAEMIRDQALAVSGLLAEKVGGPSVKPYQPAGLWQELAGGDGYKSDQGDALYRRSLYTYWRRTIQPPSMITFDSPTRETCAVRENRTNTPLQALNLMNDVAYLEASRKLAERMLVEGGASAGSRIAHAFRLVLARAPKAKEEEILLGLLDKFQTKYAKDPKAAEDLLRQGESAREKTLAAKDLAAYTGIASLILNLDETVTRQ
jgi:hypothetical protein